MMILSDTSKLKDITITLDMGITPRPVFNKKVNIGQLSQVMNITRGNYYTVEDTDYGEITITNNVWGFARDFQAIGTNIVIPSVLLTDSEIVDALGLNSYSGFVWIDIGRMRIILQLVRPAQGSSSVPTARVTDIYYNGTRYNPGSNGDGIVTFTESIINRYPQGAFIGIYPIIFREHQMYALMVSGSTSYPLTQNSVFNIAAISQNAFQGNVVEPYSNSEQAGDPEGQGGQGDGVKQGDGYLPASQTALVNVAPFGHGFHIYNFSPQNYSEFTDAMWGRNANVFQELWQKFLNYRFNPWGAVIACHYLPTDFIPLSTPTSVVKIAGVDISINCNEVTQQFVTQNIGHLNLAAQFNSFADYTHTRIVVNIPFCGSVEIDPSAVMRYQSGSLDVEMACDILTGNVIASVWVNNGVDNPTVIAQITGNCAYHIPVTGNDNGMGSILGMIMGNVGSLVPRENTHMSGNFAGNVSWGTELVTSVQVTTEIPIYTPNYNRIFGRPSHASGIVGDFTGFAMFDVDDVEVVGATFSERLEIADFLRSGVYV